MQNQLSPRADGATGICPGPGQIQSGYLRGLKSLVERLGGSYRRVLERYDVNIPSFEQSDYHLDARVAVALLDDCSAMFGDRYFGLLLAEQQDPDVFGCITAMARAAPDFKTALECFVDFVPVLNSPEGELELVVTEHAAELRWRSMSDLSFQANQHGLLLFVKTLRMLGGHDFRPTHATLQASLSARQREGVEGRVGCRVRKSASNAIGFSTEILRRVSPTRNRMLYAVLRTHLEELRSARTPTTGARVEQYIRDALPIGRCGVQQCADGMRIPVRTLQRRLAEEKQSFSDLVGKQRVELATHHLRRHGESLARIALDLGYSDQTSFCRAFKRWTGLSPQTYRRQLAWAHHSIRGKGRPNSPISP
jgi:AraC-like DNA-binding protein